MSNNTSKSVRNSKKAAVIINVDIKVEKKVKVASWTATLKCNGKELTLTGKGKASEAPFKQALLQVVGAIKNKDAFLVVTHNIAEFQTWFWKTPNATATLTKLTGFKLTCRLAQ